MLAELLLVLSGHPSAFFIPSPSPTSVPTTLAVSSSLADYLHPGEIASLHTLGQLAFNYSTIRRWANGIQKRAREAVLASAVKGKHKAVDDEVDQYLSTLAGSLLDALGDYEILIVTTEARVLAVDPALVQDQQGYVPLSSLIATFSPWQAPMAALANLVNTLSNEKPTPGRLLDLMDGLSQTGDPTLERIFTKMLDGLRHLFLIHLVVFLLHGLAPIASSPTTPSIALDIGPDPLSPQHRVYALNEDLFASSIRGVTRESILYVGRVAATLRREGRSLPKSLVDGLRGEVLAVKGLVEGGGLDRAVQQTRAEVGEWLWKHVLTGPQVSEAIKSFGDYFLTRNADYAISVIREITRLRFDKLITADPHSSSSVIREQDLDLALLRASIGTAAENDRAVDMLRLKMGRGPLRALLPATSRTPKKTIVASSYEDESGIRDLFSSFLLGTPLELTTAITWPLDLFMTPPAISAYSDIHAYLVALRETHLRVLECWTSLSASQRARRKWTGATEGGTTEEALVRKNLARSAWGTVRAMLFFLDQLLGHFMTDIIDIQHRRMVDQLEGVGSTLPSSTSAPSSLRGSIRPASTMGELQRPGSPASSTHGGFDTHTVRSRVPPSASKQQTNFLDFLTLRQMHSRHLSFLREGLLIADHGFAIIIRDILETCKRFTGLVERWGGDVLPELLTEGISGDTIKERGVAVHKLAQNLNELLTDFFRALLESQNPSASTGDTSSMNHGVSASRTARTAQTLHTSRVMQRQTSFTARKVSGKSKIDLEKEERALEAEAVMGRHVEQLLLRLDFNGVLTAWMGDEDEGVPPVSVLAEGGL